MATSDLKGQVVVITGATTGIGKSCAIEFAKYGTKLVLCGRNLDGLKQTKVDCVQRGLEDSDVVIVTGDLRDDSTLDAIVKTSVDSFGGVKVVVHNAAKVHKDDGALTATKSTEPLDYYYETHVKVPYKLTERLSKHLIESKGAIVFISSIGSSPTLFPQFTGDSIFKAAQDQMARLFALTFANKGVRVNGVRPGYVPQTNIASEMHSPYLFPDKWSFLDSHTPLGGRSTTGEELARVVVFLASNQSACITGVLVNTDRGFSMAHPAVDWKQF